MTQIPIKFFMEEVYSKLSRKSFSTKKTDVYHIDDFWNLDILDLEDYAPEINRDYR